VPPAGSTSLAGHLATFTLGSVAFQVFTVDFLAAEVHGGDVWNTRPPEHLRGALPRIWPPQAWPTLAFRAADWPRIVHWMADSESTAPCADGQERAHVGGLYGQIARPPAEALDKLTCISLPCKVTCWRVPIIAPSARRHGLSDEDILHAWRNPARDFDAGEGMTMLIGPARNADLLEIGIVDGGGGPVIVHAMKARAKYLGWKKEVR
jgi:hypothetical protein